VTRGWGQRSVVASDGGRDRPNHDCQGPGLRHSTIATHHSPGCGVRIIRPGGKAWDQGLRQGKTNLVFNHRSSGGRPKRAGSCIVPARKVVFFENGLQTEGQPAGEPFHQPGSSASFLFWAEAGSLRSRGSIFPNWPHFTGIRFDDPLFASGSPLFKQADWARSNVRSLACSKGKACHHGVTGGGAAWVLSGGSSQPLWAC